MEQQVSSFNEHSDYIRAGAPSPISPDLFVTGSYDQTVKLFDTREKQAVLTVTHGSPVESTLFLPSGGIFISAGGKEIKVWDIFNGGRLITNVSHHHKTITTLCLASNNSRLMSGSLDRHVKIIDVGTFKEVHNINFPNAILSMSISNNDEVLAVGMSDGIISLRTRKELAPKHEEKKGLFKFAPDTRKQPQAQQHQSSVDLVVKRPSRIKVVEPVSEKHLRKMEFKEALSSALKPYCLLKRPDITCDILHELLRRNVLHIAYLDLQDNKVEILLKYFRKHLGDVMFTPVIIDAANVFIDVFENQMHTFSLDIMRLYRLFLKELKEEIEVCKKICQLEGAISMLLSGSQINIDTDIDSSDQIVPSAKALEDIVIDV